VFPPRVGLNSKAPSHPSPGRLSVPSRNLRLRSHFALHSSTYLALAYAHSKFSQLLVLDKTFCTERLLSMMRSSITLSPLRLSPSDLFSTMSKRQQLQAPGKFMSVLVLYVPGSSTESSLSSHNSQGGTIGPCRLGEQDHSLRTSCTAAYRLCRDGAAAAGSH
jgi:hypothetical protein